MTISFKATSYEAAGVTAVQIAVDLVKQGASVLFLAPGGSVPVCTLTERQRKRPHDCGHHHALTTVAAVRRVGARLTAEYAPAPLNLAVVAYPSKLIVVDADNADGVTAWTDRSGHGPTVRTPGKQVDGRWIHKDGAHFVYQLPDDVELPERIGVLKHEDGYDVRWTGYSLVPPSVRPEGAYRFVGDVMPAPAWLVALIREHLDARRSHAGPRADMPTVAQWSRDTPWADIMADLDFEPDATDRCGCPTWTRPDGAHRKSAVTHEPALCEAGRFDFLEGHGPAHFYSTEAPYDLGGRTVTKLTVYAAVHHGGDIRAAMDALGLYGPLSDDMWAWVDGLPDVDEPDELAEVPVLPDAMWSARPVLGRIRDLARARMVGPDALLAAVLGHVLCSIGPHVQLPALVGGRASLNMFYGLVGRTGQGKGAAVSAAAAMFPAAPFQTVQPGTGEGLAASYVRPGGKGKPPEQFAETVLFDVAEVQTLGALAERRGTTLEAQLRQLFMGERLGFANASHDRRLTVPPHAYRAVMLVGVQPEHAGTLLADGAATGGTGGRFVWLDGSRDPGRVRGRRYAEPELAEWLAPPGWAAWADMLVDPVTDPRPNRVVIELPPAAVDAVREARLDALIEGKHADTLDRHGLLIRIKLAAGLMLLDRRTEVTDQDWDLAGLIMDTSRRVRAYVLRVLGDAAKAEANGRRQAKAEDAKAEHAARVEYDLGRISRRVLTHMRKHADVDYCTLKCVRRYLGRDGHLARDAMDLLERMGKVRVITNGKGGSAWSCSDGMTV